MLIINGEFDILRSKEEAYAHKLIEAGVPVAGVRYHGTTHDFVMLNPITNTPVPRGTIGQASHGLKKGIVNLTKQFYSKANSLDLNMTVLSVIVKSDFLSNISSSMYR